MSSPHSEFDSLTGLYNSRSLEREVRRLIERERSKPAGFALLLLDIDRFKAVNDQYGHCIGDDVLRAVADLLRKWTTDGGLACRWAGGEFALLLPNCAPHDACALAESLQSDIGVAELGPARIKVSVSFGVACYPKDASDFDHLMYHADMALHRQKRSGGDGPSSAGAMAMLRPRRPVLTDAVSKRKLPDPDDVA